MTTAPPATGSSGILVRQYDVTLMGSPTEVPLRAHVKARREQRTVVFLALLNDDILGHSLIEPVSKDSLLWQGVGDGAVLSALANARLVELRGLEVNPESRSRGVAAALLRSQLTWLSEHPDLLAVAEVWRGNPGSTHMATQLGIWLGVSPDEQVDHYKYDADYAREYLESTSCSTIQV